MKQMCQKRFESPCVCRNELSNPRYVTVVCKLVETVQSDIVYNVICLGPQQGLDIIGR